MAQKQNIEAAFKDMVDSVASVLKIHTQTKRRGAAARDFILAIEVGDVEPIEKIGCTDHLHSFTLNVRAKGQIEPFKLSKIVSEIDAVLAADRRRGGWAQTTDTSGIWSPVPVAEQQGSELTKDVIIRIHETGV